MAIRVVVRIEGADEVVKRLLKLETKIQKRIMKKAMREGFKHTLRNVKARVPVEHGHLKRSLKLRSKRTRKGIGFAIFTDRDKLDQKQLGEGRKHRKPKPGQKEARDGFYPAHLELGYLRQDGTHVPGLGFMRGGLKATRKKVRATIIKKLLEGVEGTLVKMT